ncbi:MAG: EAL domain-containing protein [Firmicutes bacterium]|nr:EAL domain-containing protein [Bacillota bacterium]
MKKHISVDGINIKRNRIVVIFSIIVMLLISGMYLRFAWNRYQDNASKEAIMLAQSLGALIVPEQVSELTGSSEDEDKQVYSINKSKLFKLVKTNNPIKFAYLMGQKDNNIVFLIDSEENDSPDHSPPGQVYSEADAELFNIFKSGNTILSAPSTDRWGTWISALVPILDPVSGKVIAVFGIDYSASEWNDKLWIQMIPDITIILSMLALLFILLNYRSQRLRLKELNEKISYDEVLYHSVFEQAPIGISVYNDKSITEQSEINPMFGSILGRNIEELKKAKWTDITHPDDIQEDYENFEKFKKGETTGYTMEKRYLKPDGSSVWVNMKIAQLLGSQYNNSNYMCLIEDISAHKEIEKSLIESERSKSILISNIPGMAYRCNYDLEWTMQFISDGCLKLTGYTPESLINNKEISFNELIVPKYREYLYKEWERILPQKLHFSTEYEIITASGERKWVLELGQGIRNDKGEVEALEGIILDITDRKKIENNLKYNNEHDSLTGLYNRKYLETVLQNEAMIKTDEKRAIIGINLSVLNLVSVTYGFYYSQDLIKKAAEVLISFCSEKHQLFNTYSDRFVFYIKNYKDKNELIEFCESIIEALEPVLNVVRSGAGIGVVEIEYNSMEDVENLLRNLLIASEKAIAIFNREFGFCFYDNDMKNQITREEIIRCELIKILKDRKNEKFYLQFQPILDLNTNKICGFESLARLESESLGMVPPLEFIAIAEKTKMIIPLGETIIFKAFKFLNMLTQKGHESINLTINISPVQLLSKDFVKKVIEMISEMQVEPSRIGFEITESIFASNYLEINNILGELKSVGIEILIDDFGTEYSSFARVRELNINVLKIDKYFADNLLLLEEDKTITSDIISMAHKLGYSVIAEGIEHEKQRQYLKKYGCDKIQGYLVARPLDMDVAIEMLTKPADVINN